MAISSTLRFEVLKRDHFACRYCGRSPERDGVRLEIDHVRPRADGGVDTIENLVAACFDCNRSKSAIPLDRARGIEPDRRGLLLNPPQFELVDGPLDGRTVRTDYTAPLVWVTRHRDSESYLLWLDRLETDSRGGWSCGGTTVVGHPQWARFDIEVITRSEREVLGAYWPLYPDGARAIGRAGAFDLHWMDPEQLVALFACGRRRSIPPVLMEPES